MNTEGNAEPLSNQWLRRQAQQFGKGARHSTPYPPTKSTTPSMITRRCLPRFQLQNRTEPVVLKTLKGVKWGECGSHVTLSGSLHACCMAPSPVWTAGLDWPCRKLEVQGWDMGLHDPGRGPRSQMAFFTSKLSNGIRTLRSNGRAKAGSPLSLSKGLLACRIKSYKSARIGQEAWPDSTGAPGLPRWCQATPSTRFLASDSHPPHRCPDLTQWRKAVVCAQKFLESPVGWHTIGPLCVHC